MLGGAYPCAGFVINAILVLWRRILSRCAPIGEYERPVNSQIAGVACIAEGCDQVRH